MERSGRTWLGGPSDGVRQTQGTVSSGNSCSAQRQPIWLGRKFRRGGLGGGIELAGCLGCWCRRCCHTFNAHVRAHEVSLRQLLAGLRCWSPTAGTPSVGHNWKDRRLAASLPHQAQQDGVLARSACTPSCFGSPIRIQAPKPMACQTTTAAGSFDPAAELYRSTAQLLWEARIA